MISAGCWNQGNLAQSRWAWENAFGGVLTRGGPSRMLTKAMSTPTLVFPYWTGSMAQPFYDRLPDRESERQELQVSRPICKQQCGLIEVLESLRNLAPLLGHFRQPVVAATDFDRQALAFAPLSLPSDTQRDLASALYSAVS